MNAEVAVKLVEAADLLRRYGWDGPHLCIPDTEPCTQEGADHREFVFVRPGRGSTDKPKPADHTEPELQKVVGHGWEKAYYDIRLYAYPAGWKFEISIMVPADQPHCDNQCEVYDGWDEMVLNEGNLQAAHENFGLDYPRPVAAA